MNTRVCTLAGKYSWTEGAYTVTHGIFLTEFQIIPLPPQINPNIISIPNLNLITNFKTEFILYWLILQSVVRVH